MRGLLEQGRHLDSMKDSWFYLYFAIVARLLWRLPVEVVGEEELDDFGLEERWIDSFGEELGVAVEEYLIVIAELEGKPVQARF